MNLPSDEFLQAIGRLRDRHGYTGKLTIDCAQGKPLHFSVPSEPMRIYVMPKRCEAGCKHDLRGA